GASVDGDPLAAPNPLGGGAGAQNGRNVILSRDDRAVAERAADVGDHARGEREERRPGGRRDPGDKDVAWTHLVERLRTVNNPGRAGHLPGAGGDSFEDVTFGLAGPRGQHSADVDAKEAGSALDRQGHRWSDRALLFPG